MEVYTAERRISRRLQFKTPLRVRVWKSGPAEQLSESENLSERGAFFATDALLVIGSAVEILLKMPQEVTGKPAVDWRCTGHVVRLEPIDASHDRLGVGVQFDCYEILRSTTEIPL
jgi:Tfp pilus assembly protein PilZ